MTWLAEIMRRAHLWLADFHTDRAEWWTHLKRRLRIRPSRKSGL